MITKRVEFNSRQYEFAHGKMPRGRGTWFFFFSYPASFRNCIQVNGSFTEAKKAAAEEARKQGVTEVFIGSWACWAIAADE